MRRALRQAYDRELALLKEGAAEFAAEYPGIADRLGGLIEDNLDPAVGGLLEGAAFLAAQVQLRIGEEFRTFTRALLGEVFPDGLAPMPPAMMVEATPPVGDAAIEGGLRFARGSSLEARFEVEGRRVACRFRLGADLVVWPLALTRAAYHAAPGRLGALGVDAGPGTRAGLELELAKLGEAGPLSGLGIEELPIHLMAPMPEAVALYEQLVGDEVRVWVRWQDAQGDAALVRLPSGAVDQVGFGAEAALLDRNVQTFEGFALLREAFAFPRKFLGIRLRGLGPALRRVTADRAQLIFEFPTSNPVLAARIDAGHLRLHAAPAVNLFEDSAHVRLDARRHEYLVAPAGGPLTQVEVQAVAEVAAIYPGGIRVPAQPLYGPPPAGQRSRALVNFTIERRPRRLGAAERRFDARPQAYLGTETFVSIYEPPGAEPAERLQLRLLCSNRHLTELLPIAGHPDAFRLVDNQDVALTCVSGPSPPLESLVDADEGTAPRGEGGEAHWRLVSFLALGRLGLDGRADGAGRAAALREMLGLFAPRSDAVARAQVDGLLDVATRPVVRTVRRADGHHAARGLEVTLLLDEDAFEGSGPALLGAVLDRFLAEHTAVNSFTQCVVATRQRGVIKRWPPRTGRGPLL